MTYKRARLLYKRARLVGAVCIAAIAIMLIVARCVPTEVAANVVGPPTLYEHVAGINASLAFFRYVAGILATMFTFILGLLGYIWRLTNANMKENIDENKDDIKDIKKTFMSIAAHDRIGPHHN